MSNFKNNRWLSIITIVLLVANIVTLAMLWSHKNKDGNDQKPPQPPGQVFEFVSKELALDTAQQEAYKKLRDAHQASQRQMQDSIRKAKDALFLLLQQPTVSDSLVQEYSKRATAFDQQMDIITFKHFQQVRALCNLEQQKKFDAVIKDVLRRMQGPRNRQGPPPGARGEGPGQLPPPPGNGNEPPPPQ